MIAAHADWSVNPGKRWFTRAHRAGPGLWHATAPRPVGDPSTWAATLLAEGPALALGLDLPLGLPRAYARQRPEADFPAFLRTLSARPGFWRVADSIAGVSADSPFYPARGRRGMTRLEHALALGMAEASGLCRLCDLATAERPAGAPLFWTLGANQTGKAAISAWRDWLVPALAAGAPYRLWPFEGGLHALLAPGRAVLAEVYPAECLRHLGLRLSGSKRSRAVRLQALPGLRQAMARLGITPDAALEAALAEGFGADAAGEDRFDSLLGLLGLIGVLDGHRPDFVPDDPWLRRWEGWVLGQTSLPNSLPAAPYPAGA
ncbi:hypothetical protein MVG78_15450 [Roseomonas gilardii subsp. gilardii]|uniref:hypothetical protein n=1 Tax=Roseomonas gilardii TaxID=257708 RepID=UPI001FF7D940|nr:hypothetical protein [Roseomonas gilardii]UPG71919.1 hypothetical protein MVG78_15450 [Roseomonas gilardii subsp. gilardii]